MPGPRSGQTPHMASRRRRPAPSHGQSAFFGLPTCSHVHQPARRVLRPQTNTPLSLTHGKNFTLSLTKTCLKEITAAAATNYLQKESEVARGPRNWRSISRSSLSEFHGETNNRCRSGGERTDNKTNMLVKTGRKRVQAGSQTTQMRKGHRGNPGVNMDWFNYCFLF